MKKDQIAAELAQLNKTVAELSGSVAEFNDRMDHVEGKLKKLLDRDSEQFDKSSADRNSPLSVHSEVDDLTSMATEESFEEFCEQIKLREQPYGAFVDFVYRFSAADSIVRELDAEFQGEVRLYSVLCRNDDVEMDLHIQCWAVNESTDPAEVFIFEFIRCIDSDAIETVRRKTRDFRRYLPDYQSSPIYPFFVFQPVSYLPSGDEQLAWKSGIHVIHVDRLNQGIHGIGTSPQGFRHEYSQGLAHPLSDPPPFFVKQLQRANRQEAAG